MIKKWILCCLMMVGFLAGAQTCLPDYGMKVRKININGSGLAYAEKGKGQVILFIHGLGGNISHWSKVMDGLADSFHCVAVDLPGYGWSDKAVQSDGRDQLQYYADVISAFIRKKKWKNVVLAGHSMGGQVAIITALQNKKIARLLLVAPAGLETFTEKEGQLLINATKPEAFEKQEEAIIRYNIKQTFFRQPADAEKLVQDRLAMKNCPSFKDYCITVSYGVKGMLAHPVKDSLSKLTMPVKIVFGAEDQLIPNRYLHTGQKTEELAAASVAQIPKGSMEMIPGGGHLLPYEKNIEMISIIKRFLQ
jgi:pimeloyl-ACP methyl ester carboxylesterase